MASSVFSIFSIRFAAALYLFLSITYGWMTGVNAATFMVINTDDAGEGSLRWALDQADGDAVLDSIHFDIPTSDPGYNSGPPARWIIRPDSTYNDIWHPVVIDGFTQPGASANTIAAPGALNADLKIVLNGVNTGADDNGLVLRGSNSTVRGLVVNNFLGFGIYLANPGPCLIEGNYIGTHVSGNYSLSNGTGIEVQQGQHTIGGTTPGARNLISGNNDIGIALRGVIGAVVENTVVQGNLIGLRENGIAAIPNGSGTTGGIYLENFEDVTIGGTASGACNVISGNDGAGIFVSHTSTIWEPSGLVVQGNYIGTAASGDSDLGNSSDGIHLEFAFAGISPTDALIGGTTGAARNIISGNGQNGIYTELDSLTIQGNYIGTDVTGTVDLGNDEHGIYSLYADYILVGGAVTGSGNLISGNGGCGISMNSAGYFTVQGNLVGTDVTGSADIGNASHGVYLNGSNHRIGGTGLNESNTIAFNGSDGIHLYAAYNNALLSNSVFSNGGLGIDLEPNGVTANDYQDSDFGSNLLQNFPVLADATTGAGGTVVSGSLNSVPDTEFYLEFYHNTSKDPTNYGEGGTCVDSITVTTDGNGDAPFTVTVNPALPVGDFVCATATDPDGNTSEFGANAEIERVSLLVTNTDDNGSGSLRESILNANGLAGADTIYFDIPTSDGGYVPGPPAYWSIQPDSALPIITDTVVIDGYTQTGAQPNTEVAPDTSDAILVIELRGDNTPSGNGLRISGASDCEIRGLVINRFNGHGIRFDTISSGQVIEGNYIGTDISGILDRGNGNAGIFLKEQTLCTIGGVSPGARNIISGNNGTGINLVDSDNNIIQGNFVGTDVSGRVDRGNSGSGIRIYNSEYNTVGGIPEAARNVVSGNGSTDAGILVYTSTHAGSHNVIQGNYIGVDVTAETAIPNSTFGVRIIYASNTTIGGSEPGAENVISGNAVQGVFIYGDFADENVVQGNYIGTNAELDTGLGNYIGVDFQFQEPKRNIIGGMNPGEGNIIWYNDIYGIRVMDGTRNVFLGNSIYGNGDIGIDIGSGGVTPNDSADVDGGSNQSQNFPVIETVLVDPLRTVVSGSLNSMPDSTFHLQFFYSSVADPSGYGEGEVFFADTVITVDAMGDASFSYAFDGISIPGDSYVTATASDMRGNTSEFSNAVAGLSMFLDGYVMGGDLQLEWTPISSAAGYWVYGANNQPYFIPDLSSPYDHRLTTLPSGTTTWSSSNGIGDDLNNWSYLIIAVDAMAQEIVRTDRFGEYDFILP